MLAKELKRIKNIDLENNKIIYKIIILNTSALKLPWTSVDY